MPHPKIKKKLEDLHMTILSDNFDDATNPEEIRLCCIRGHEMTYTFNSLSVTLNRKKHNAGEDEKIELCKQCGMIKRAEEQKVKKIEELKTMCIENGHEFIGYIENKDGHVQFEYKCGGCGKISNTFDVNMKMSNLSVCKHCNQEEKMNDEEKVREELLQMGHILISYNGNKNVIFFCSCGHPEPAIGTLWKLRNGHKCGNCADERRKNTNIERYGGSGNLFTSEVIKERIVQTCLEKYGCRHPMQNYEILHKALSSMSRIKPTIVNGVVRNLLGYEPQGVKYITEVVNPILGRRLEESELLFGRDVGFFEYRDVNEKDKRYFPDMKIKDSNIIIEIKSIYTYNIEPETNILKFLAVSRSGNYLQAIILETEDKVSDVWIFSPNGEFTSSSGKTLEDVKHGIL
jgi:hypothetical protein